MENAIGIRLHGPTKTYGLTLDVNRNIGYDRAILILYGPLNLATRLLSKCRAGETQESEQGKSQQGDFSNHLLIFLSVNYLRELPKGMSLEFVQFLDPLPRLGSADSCNGLAVII